MDAGRFLRDRAGSATAYALSTGVALAMAAVLYLAFTTSDSARAAGVSRLRQSISSKQSRAQQLSAKVHAASRQLGAISADIATLTGHLDRVQASLSSGIAKLRRIENDYQVTHARLVRLENYESRAEGVLRQQLVGAYESQPPDLITVILQAKGFRDLLDQIGFIQKIQRQDARIVAAVRSARRAVALEATRLGALQLREHNVVVQVLADRNALARTQQALYTRRAGVARTRAAKAAALNGTRAQLATLRTELAQIQAQQAAAAAQRAAASAPSATAAPSAGAPSSAAAPTPNAPPASASGFVFPLPISAAAAPGSWSLDQGVDISAPGGTPEYAVCSGTIVLHGIGGFGPWAPVLHCDSPLDGYSYVYYGHAGPANQLPVGTHVGAGQVMSEVGPGIVGLSSGPHVEIGFCDGSGTPLGGGTASTMYSLLRGAY